MKKQFKFLTKLLLASVLLMSSSLVFATTSKSYLFIQSASSGSLQATGKNEYRLTLNNVHPYLMYFSNRPDRQAGIVKITDFLSDWQKGTDNFKQDAPNAGLHAVMHGKNIDLVLELNKPEYDAQKHILSYQVKILNHATINKNLDGFDYVALFIDNLSNVCYGCGGPFA